MDKKWKRIDLYEKYLDKPTKCANVANANLTASRDGFNHPHLVIITYQSLSKSAIDAAVEDFIMFTMYWIDQLRSSGLPASIVVSETNGQRSWTMKRVKQKGLVFWQNCDIFGIEQSKTKKVKET